MVSVFWLVCLLLGLYVLVFVFVDPWTINVTRLIRIFPDILREVHVWFGSSSLL
ncbi:hypothetical protein BDV36DRAFT_255067 [Aspergillus pseudocaelatus]|uniref:Uncharacterized protein n=1 Tax=Aspergillus pseudocaelatus TaxID=1825620 RepID=A0ABQ6WLQ0_9EURO|nr:hypothetical protein BDV36DRAFT_255067 [Aspergillus pseudocaelatus]